MRGCRKTSKKTKELQQSYACAKAKGNWVPSHLVTSSVCVISRAIFLIPGPSLIICQSQYRSLSFFSFLKLKFHYTTQIFTEMILYDITVSHIIFALYVPHTCTIVYLWCCQFVIFVHIHRSMSNVCQLNKRYSTFLSSVDDNNYS